MLFENRKPAWLGVFGEEVNGRVMTITWYPDAFFLLNAGMNGWLLYLLKKLLKLQSTPFRLLAAACAGAVGSCLAFFAAFGFGQTGFWEVQSPGVSAWLWGGGLLVFGAAAGGVMIRLAFGKSSLREMLRRLAVLAMLTALTGGFLSIGDPGKAGLPRLAVFLPAAAGAAFLSAQCAGALKGSFRRDRTVCQMVLYSGGRSVHVRALVDTGNQLFEPYTHCPVHVITRAVSERLWERLSGVIYIPYHAVGTRSGLLPAVRAERMELWQEGRPVRTWKRPWLAISEEPLSLNRKYEMLLHGEEQE